MSSTAMQPKPPSPAALRQRRLRERWAQGIIRTEFYLAPSAINDLIILGWLKPEARENREAIEDAFLAFSTKALALRVAADGG